MSSFKSVLITGGAGYVGSILTGKLVKENYDVKVVDSLVFGNDGISSLIDDKKIKFFNMDIRETNKLSSILNDIDCVIHLAAIVGEPLCKKVPIAAKQINEYVKGRMLRDLSLHQLVVIMVLVLR